MGIQVSPSRPIKLLQCFIFFLTTINVDSLATQPQGEATFSLFDRFRPSCPADIGSIQRFDSSLATGDDPDTVWIAIFRSSNNKPSVIVKDEFMNAMRMATNIPTDRTITESKDERIENTSNSVMESTETPVAVARLTPSQDLKNCWVLDKMRCVIKKEETNADCDGGSEHTEALCVAIDAILMHHLTNHKEASFDGAIRTKATLVSGKILEDRGFKEVSTLSKDMASHTCSLDACMENYANRAVSTSAKGAGSRERAIEICSLLGQIDREKDLKASNDFNSANDEEDYDPWAGIKKFL